MSNVKYEHALKELEEIVEQLEAGDLTLDESLEKYEAGVKALKQCYKILEGAEKKIEILTKGEEGELQAKSFEPNSNHE